MGTSELHPHFVVMLLEQGKRKQYIDSGTTKHINCNVDPIIEFKKEDGTTLCGDK
jgi:hypothetical protein